MTKRSLSWLPIVVGAAVLFGVVETASANTNTTGTVSDILVNNIGNYSFALTGGPNMCTNGHLANNRGAVEVGIAGTTSDGRKAMLSMLQSALLSGRQVTVVTSSTVRTTGWGCTVIAVQAL